MSNIQYLAQLRQNFLAVGAYGAAEIIRELIEAELKTLTDSTDREAV